MTFRACAFGVAWALFICGFTCYNQMVRIGATFGFAGFIFYAGRHYYRSVVAASLGFSRNPATPA